MRGCASCAACITTVRRGAARRRSVDQLRGIEGVRVREIYKLLAQRHGVEWEAALRPADWDLRRAQPLPFGGDRGLYGVSEAAVLAAGYAPAIGFLHTGKPQSFVYDIADLFKFETVVPEAFRVVAAVKYGRALDGERIIDPVAAVRRRCRDAFRRTALLARLIPRSKMCWRPAVLRCRRRPRKPSRSPSEIQTIRRCRTPWIV